jgi:hypothetical protein
MRPAGVAVLVALAVAAPAPAAVVINEIMYHPPEDRDDLQFVELHNTADQPAAVGGWQLRGVKFTLPAGTTIPAGGFLVVAKDPAALKKHYGVEAVGPFPGVLDHGSERVELVDAAGKKVDSVKYRSRAPWPVAADGAGSSLERICPTAPGDSPENWAPSPPPETAPPRAAGTPGKKNSVFAAKPPPSVTELAHGPVTAAPDRPITVEAVVKADAGLKAVELLYRVARPGGETKETAVPMTRGANGRYTATVPGQKAGQLVRVRVRAVDAAGGERVFPHPNELRPAATVYVTEKVTPGKIPWGFLVNVRPTQGGSGGPNPPARGPACFVYVDEKTATPRVFDFVSAPPRKGGFKVRFHRDHMLDKMGTINLIYEDPDRSVVSEPLSYVVHRMAGNAAPRTDHVRTWVDGRPQGFLLLIEQPNKQFLRFNTVDTHGNLYKCVYFGGDVVGRHEKKTRVTEGHADVVDLVRRLTRVKGDEQWELIKKEIDVRQVATHYAVRHILSDWDGFFNNYYLYHDTGGTGKWTFYPWDQDKTWGMHDGIGGYDVFFDMPLTFGAEGDRPVGGAWWRPGGDVSRPVLANPRFRKVFLARVKELLETVYTEEKIGPLVTAMGERLEDEVRYRAQVRREDPARAIEHFRRNLGTLREHVKKRREFLLKQPEIKAAGKFDPADWK